MGIAAGKKNYSDSFKRNALNLLINRNKSVVEVADDLGLTAQTLYKWKRERTDLVEPSVETDPNLAIEENKKLRAQLAQMEEEMEILKKATAFFASQK